MGKKAREKRERKTQGKPVRRARLVEKPLGNIGVGLTSGDLRLLETHVDNYLKGVKEAETALRLLGRDASATVMEMAERLKNKDLLEFGKRLVAVKPTVETNMMELRHESIVENLARAKATALDLDDAPIITVTGPTVALFDPLKIADALARGGRPRNQIERVARGDLAWFAPGADRVKVSLTREEADADADALELRLVIESGLFFVGPAEAADGPRMGTVRFDPFRTGLDDFIDRGRFVALEPGPYALRVRREGTTKVRVVIRPSAARGPLDLALSALGNVPG